MYKNIFIFFVFLLYAMYNIAAQAKPIVGVYYWPHWGDTNPEAEVRLKWSESMFTPFLGEYDANEKTIAEKQIKKAVEYNISLFILNAYEKRLQGFLSASNLNDIKIVLQVDLSEINGFRDPRNFGSVLDWLHGLGFKKDAYLRIDNRPVLLIGDFNLLLKKIKYEELKSGIEKGKELYKKSMEQIFL